MIGIAFCFLPLIIAIIICTAGFKVKLTQQLLACLFGLIIVLPVSVIQYFLPGIPGLQNAPVWQAFLKSVLIYGLVEELFKMFALLPLPKKNSTMLNFFLLSFVLGLALGCFESVVYYFDHLQVASSKGAQLLYGQIALRIFSADIIHMTCAGLSGLFVYSCTTEKKRISFFVMAVVIHGVYDFFAGFSNSLRWFAAVVVLLAIAECRIKYVSLQNNEKE